MLVTAANDGRLARTPPDLWSIFGRDPSRRDDGGRREAREIGESERSRAAQARTPAALAGARRRQSAPRLAVLEGRPGGALAAAPLYRQQQISGADLGTR